LVSGRPSAHYEGKSDHVLQAHQSILELITSKKNKKSKNQKTKTGVKSTQKTLFFIFLIHLKNERNLRKVQFLIRLLKI